MEGEILNSVIRTIGGFTFLLVVIYFLGKITSAKMNNYGLALTVTVGSIGANAGFDTKLHFWAVIASLVTTAIAGYLLGVLALKSKKVRELVGGKPVVIMKNGKILEDHMRKINYSMDLLNQALREKEIFNIEEIEYAVVENDGKISVLKKEPFRNVMKKDLLHHQTFKPSSLPIELIVGGEIIKDNLQLGNYTETWLMKELSKRNVQVQDVFYGVVSSNGKLFIDRFQDERM